MPHRGPARCGPGYLPGTRRRWRPGRRVPRNVARRRGGLSGSGRQGGACLGGRYLRLGHRPPTRRRHLPARRGLQDRQLPRRRVSGPVRAVQARPALDSSCPGRDR
jgi:hypothetical protein